MKKLPKILGMALGFAMLSSTATATNPYTLKYTNNDWIALTGVVAATQPDSFTLNFGENDITVEMDDWDAYDEANLLKNGETVTVYGRIDDDFYEAKKIEAGTVYAHDRSTYYYASAADEESRNYAYTYYTYPVTVPEGTWMSVSGTVKSVNDRELTLDTGAYEVVVDTASMKNDPLDNEGFPQVDQGDIISVSGRVDDEMFEGRELQAEAITTM